MRIITWNCNGAFRKKMHSLFNLNADIIVVQECENPKESKDSDYKHWANNYLWIGDNKNKGLGIFAKSEIQMERLNWSNKFQDHFVKYFLPCRINNSVNLLAVWNHGNNSPNFGYIGQLWKYLTINKIKLNTSIIAGDFNSNAIWDQWDRWWNHTDVVNDLLSLGIESQYHVFNKEHQGQELNPTLYLQRKLNRPYHIDYIFASSSITQKLLKVQVGSPDDWLSISDHMPVICDYKGFIF